MNRYIKTKHRYRQKYEKLRINIITPRSEVLQVQIVPQSKLFYREAFQSVRLQWRAGILEIRKDQTIVF